MKRIIFLSSILFSSVALGQPSNNELNGFVKSLVHKEADGNKAAYVIEIKPIGSLPSGKVVVESGDKVYEGCARLAALALVSPGTRLKVVSKEYLGRENQGVKTAESCEIYAP